jgi:hypothetical protein
VLAGCCIVCTLLQIRIFVKLKFINCTRPGSRAGRFRCAFVRRLG